MRKLTKTKLYFLTLLVIAGMGFGSIPASAQLFGPTHTKVEVLFEQSEVVPGSEVQGAFKLTMDEHWHTYWKYAGDVGLPTEAVWSLPTGWEVGDFEWPAPTRLETSGLVSYAYEGEVLFPFLLKVPLTAELGAEVPLQVKVSWLECEESCIPGEAELATTLKIAVNPKKSDSVELIQRAQDKIPKVAKDVEVTLNDKMFYITLPSSIGGPEIQFFPNSAGQIAIDAPQTVITKGERSVLRVSLPADSENPVTRLEGLLIGDDTAVSFQSTVDKTVVPTKSADLATILLTAGAAFIGGLILNLMPCVFPVLSIKVLGIVEQSRSEGRPAWHHGAVFTIGVLVSFWIMSGILIVVRAAGQEVGWGYHLQNPLMIGGLAVLFLLISLNLFGVFEVGENLTQLSGAAEKKEGFAHSFWSGVLTTLAATPCTAPFMGGAVGFALSQPTWVAFLIFSLLALGVAAPYMTLTLFPRLLDKLPRPGAWMITFKQILAFPMLLAVVWLTWVFGSQTGTDRMALFLLALLTIAFASWVYGKWGCSFEPKEKLFGLAGASIVLLGSLFLGYTAAQVPDTDLWQDYSPELVAQLKAEGKPFFLDFTADWCTSCKANELVALSRSEVQQKFKTLGVTLVKADWTKEDPVITNALAEFGRAGVPLYVLYPGGESEPQILPEVLVPSIVLKALDSIDG